MRKFVTPIIILWEGLNKSQMYLKGLFDKLGHAEFRFSTKMSGEVSFISNCWIFVARLATSSLYKQKDYVRNMRTMSMMSSTYAMSCIIR